MTKPALAYLRHHLRKLLRTSPDDEQADTALLTRFVAHHDEAAFAALLQRHGPMILAVCRQILGDAHAAEDAFQATFLILARKAASVRHGSGLSAWLHRVATNVARNARASGARRRIHEGRAAAAAPAHHAEEPMDHDWHAALHEEVNRLPGRYRAPVVLCHLQGKTHETAARELGWPVGTVRSALARGREMLRRRLLCRQLTLTSGVVAAVLAEGQLPAVPAALAQATLRGVTAQAASETAASAAVAALVETTLPTLAPAKGRAVLLVGLVLLLLGTGAGWLALRGRGTAGAPNAFVAEAPDEEEPEAVGGRRDLHGDPLPDGALLRLGSVRLRQPGQVVGAQFAPDGATLVTADGEGVLRLWNVADGKQLRVRTGHDGPVTAIAHSADGRLLASAGADGSVRLWERVTGKRLRALTGSLGPVIGLNFSADDQALIAVTHTGDVIRWDCASGKVQQKLPGVGAPVSAVAFAPDGCTVALALDRADLPSRWSTKVAVTAAVVNDDRETGLPIVIRNVTTGAVVRRWPAHRWNASQLAFALDGRLLISRSASSSDRHLRFWDPTTGAELTQFPRLDCFFGSFIVTPDGRTLLAADGARPENSLVIYDLAERKLQRALDLPVCRKVLAVAPDGTRLAVISPTARAIGLYSLTTGEPLHHLGHQDAVARVAFSVDGGRLATVSYGSDNIPGEDWTLRVWDAVTGRELRRTTESSTLGEFLAFSADGRQVVTGNLRDGPWDPAANRRTAPAAAPDAEKNWPTAVAWSPDFKLIALGFHSGAIAVRDHYCPAISRITEAVYGQAYPLLVRQVRLAL